jgi:hypothetical protein
MKENQVSQDNPKTPGMFLRKIGKTALMAGIVATTFFGCSVLLDALWGTRVFIGMPSLLAQLFLVGILAATFYQLISPLDDSHYGRKGALGWVITGVVYAILIKILILIVKNQFLLVVIAIGLFSITQLYVFKTVSMVKKNN